MTVVEAAPAALPLVPGRLYALGGTIRVDGRVSWVPPGTTGLQPLNTYALLAGDAVLLIDPGVAALGPLVAAQLATLVPDGAPVSVLVTRTELDCVTALPAVEARFEVAAVHYTGGITLRLRRPETAVHRYNIPAGATERLELAPGIDLDVHAPRLRLLPTLWPYDPVSRTLFTSDVFGHTLCAADGDRILADGDRDETVAADIRAHLLAKLAWLDGALTAGAADDVAAVFAGRTIERVAPSHGRVFAGADVCARHGRLVEQVVREAQR